MLRGFFNYIDGIFSKMMFLSDFALQYQLMPESCIEKTTTQVKTSTILKIILINHEHHSGIIIFLY